MTDTTSQMPQTPAHLLFADAAVEALEANKTLPAKFTRMIKRSGLLKQAAGKRVAIKMHLGGEIGFTTIHPLFVSTLVDQLRDADAASVVVIDGKDPADGIPRGYTEEVLGCPIENCFGPAGDELVPQKIDFRDLDEALFGKRALDADLFIDLSHVKGHGACGFGGAMKNIAMGIIPPKTRAKLHHLEGGLSYDADACTFCLKCLKSCPNDAIKPNRDTKTISFFYHHCTFCQHCVMACPEDAITMLDRQFHDFARGMALVTARFLERFEPENLFFINIMTNITMYCDCWGFSSPSLVPDIGILMGRDIAAIDTASLDLIKAENLIPNGLPENREIGADGHLFERIHGKDPYLMVNYLAEEYPTTTSYTIETVR